MAEMARGGEYLTVAEDEVLSRALPRLFERQGPPLSLRRMAQSFACHIGQPLRYSGRVFTFEMCIDFIRRHLAAPGASDEIAVWAILQDIDLVF
jgi:hypothetical protein